MRARIVRTLGKSHTISPRRPGTLLRWQVAMRQPGYVRQLEQLLMLSRRSPVAPVGSHRSPTYGVDKPQRPTGGLPVARNRSPVALEVGAQCTRADRRRNVGDRMGAGRERGLGKPKTSPQSALTGSTGGFSA
jgi:hypothetical protein